MRLGKVGETLVFFRGVIRKFALPVTTDSLLGQSSVIHIVMVYPLYPLLGVQIYISCTVGNLGVGTGIQIALVVPFHKYTVNFYNETLLKKMEIDMYFPISFPNSGSKRNIIK